MKSLKIKGLCSLLFLVPFLSSYRLQNEIQPPSRLGGFADGVIRPLRSIDIDYNLRFGFIPSHNMNLSLEAHLKNPLTTATYGEDGYSLSRVALGGISVKGAVERTYSFLIPHENLYAGRNTINLVFSEWEGLERTWSWVTSFAFGYKPEGQEYLINDNLEIQSERGSGTIFKNGRPHILPYSFLTAGCRENFYNSENGIFSLSELRFQTRDYDGSLKPLSFKNATLKLYDNHDLFSFLSPFIDRYGTAIEFSLKGVKNDDQTTSFLLKDPLAISLDTKRIYDGANHPENCSFLEEIPLATLKVGETRTYNFALEIEGVGEIAEDSLLYRFSIIHDTNYFGECDNSTWCVIEDY